MSNNTILIVDEIFENCHSTTNGGCFYISASINVICKNDIFINCKSDISGGCFYLSPKSCNLFCLSCINNTAPHNPVFRLQQISGTTSLNLSSISGSTLTSDASGDSGAPVAFDSCKAESNSVNHSRNIIIHISGAIHKNDLGSIDRYNQFAECKSNNGIVVQFENCNKMCKYSFSNFINNNVGTSSLGLLRTYYSTSEFYYCYISGNTASVIFKNEGGTVSLIDSYVDVRITNIFREFSTTNININNLSITKCFQSRLINIVSCNFDSIIQFNFLVFLCKIFILSTNQ